MNGREFLAALNRDIPLTNAMGIDIAEFGPSKVVLKVPFAPNRNHVDTVFGGSLYAAAALGCYGLFRAISAESGIVSDNLVIQEGSIEYKAPVEGDFEVESLRPEEAEVRRFLEQLKRHGKARLLLKASIKKDGSERAVFKGSYVFKET